MPEASDAHSTAGVEALVAVTGCAAPPIAPQAAVEELLAAVARALGADAAALWSQEEAAGSGRVLDVHGLRADAGPRFERPLARVAAAGEEIALPDPEWAELGAALAAEGLAHGLAMAVPGDVGSVGALGAIVAAGRGPLTEDPLRRHAAHVGVRRLGTVLESVRLRENLERAMAQILTTDERMLGRIGLDIHDGPTQQLSVALLEVQLLERELADAEEATGIVYPPALRPALETIYETLGAALHEMRELIGHLRPAQFEDRRLSDILRDAITAFEHRNDTRVDAEMEGDFPLNGVSVTQRITLYRILQEALNNAHRHGHAAHVTVRVREAPEGVHLSVVDDGVGFDPEEVQRKRPGVPLARFGVHGMSDRAQVLGGTFEIRSAPGQGAEVRVFLPRWRGPAAEAAAAASGAAPADG
jgi:signal transduction histidine kinase